MANENTEQIGDETIVRYLLGQLSFEEEDPLDLALADDTFYERVSAIEGELITDYAWGKLPAETRRLVEQRLLKTSSQREQLAHARALFEAVKQTQSEEAAAETVDRFTASRQEIDQISEEEIASYLLGRLPAEREGQLDLALADDNFFQRVSAVEEDLINDYARGSVSVEERQSIERRLLRTADQRQLLSHAQAFLTAAERIRQEAVVEPNAARVEPSRSWRERFLDLFRMPGPLLAMGMTTAALAVFLGGAWMAYESWRLRGQNADLAQLREREQLLDRENDQLRTGAREQSERLDRLNSQLSLAQADNEKLEDQLKQARDNRGTTYFTAGGFSTAAAEGAVPRSKGEGRGNEPVVDVPAEIRLALKKDSALALLQLLITNDANSGYRLDLKAESGLTILQMNGLRPQSRDGDNLLRLVFPADLLISGKYTLNIHGNDNQRRWIFHLTVSRP